MRWLWLALVAVGCAVDGGEVGVVWLDRAQYEAEVQPILATRCGSPSCHGRADRPWSLYSPGHYRADPARTHLDEPLSAAELEANFARACVFVDVDDPAASELVTEPLDHYAGVSHGGGVIFEGTSERDYRIIVRWIEGGGQGL